jgi:hypothetical protein
MAKGPGQTSLLGGVGDTWEHSTRKHWLSRVEMRYIRKRWSSDEGVESRRRGLLALTKLRVELSDRGGDRDVVLGGACISSGAGQKELQLLIWTKTASRQGHAEEAPGDQAPLTLDGELGDERDEQAEVFS